MTEPVSQVLRGRVAPPAPRAAVERPLRSIRPVPGAPRAGHRDSASAAGPLELARRLSAARAFWLVVTAAVCLFAYVALFAVPINHDHAWLLYVAHRVLGGAVLYRDVIEVNPPLIVGFALAVEGAARALGLSDMVLFPVFVGLVAASALLATALLLRRLSLGDAGRRLLVAFAAFLLFPFAGREFGQREHLMFALFLPYLVLAALRAERRDISPRAAVGIGIAAGLAVALKPYFLLVLLPVELYLLATSGWRRAVRRPECLAAAAAIGLYLVGVLVLTPAYLGIAKFAWATYAGFVPEPYSWLLLNSKGALVLAAALAAVLVPGRPELRHLRRLLLLVMLGFLAALLWERKGWDYHWLPVLSAALLLLVVVLVNALRRLGERPRIATHVAAARSLAFLGIAAVMLGSAGQRARHPAPVGYYAGYPYYLPAMLELVERDAGKGPIMVLSTQLQAGFPLVNLTGIGWATRFNSLWPLAGLYPEVTGQPDPFPYHDPAHTSPAEHWLADAYVEDFLRARPTLLIVDRVGPSRAMAHFDYLQYFLRDPRFAAEFSAHYHLIALFRMYVIFQRVPTAAATARSAS